MRVALSDGREMSSVSIVLLSRFACIDQRSGQCGGTDADTCCGFPAQTAGVLSRFLSRLCTLYFAHGFVVGRGIIGVVHAPKMNHRHRKVNSV